MEGSVGQHSEAEVNPCSRISVEEVELLGDEFS